MSMSNYNVYCIYAHNIRVKNVISGEDDTHAKNFIKYKTLLSFKWVQLPVIDSL